jgi:hypothetical protein
VFCDETYNASPHNLVLFVIVILKQLNIKKKIDKDNFEKNYKKKNHVESHCSNPQCFVRKATVLSPLD